MPVIPATGKTRAEVRTTLEAQGYSTTVTQDIASMGMPAYTFEKGDERLVAIFFTNETVVAIAKTQYEKLPRKMVWNASKKVEFFIMEQ